MVTIRTAPPFNASVKEGMEWDGMERMETLGSKQNKL